MADYVKTALEKLNMKGITGQKEVAMAAALREWLSDFCRKDAEFAQAVAQGGPYQACLSAVAKDTGAAISDFDALSKAVNFYFPGAEVKFQMVLALAGDTDSGVGNASGDAFKILDLADFL